MAKQKIDKEKTRVLTPEFRVSYPHVFKPSVMKGTNNAPKYSITMLFPKDADLSSLKAVIRQAKIDKFGAKENWPKVMRSPVEDGDKPEHADKEGYADHYVIKASSNENSKPGVVDESVKTIIDASKFYPGCYARAYIFAYVWEFPEDSGKYGIGFILDHVQKLRDGKSFGGKKQPNEVFGAVSGGSADDDDDFGSDAASDDDDFS